MAIRDDDSAVSHRFYEDVLALLSGTLLVALGLAFFNDAALASGGIVGVALLTQYATGISFGPLFFLLNVPFYLLGVLRMGWAFTLRTVAAVALVSVLSTLTPRWIDVAAIAPFYAAIAGGSLIGVGLLILFRHRAGLGGFNILALYLQDHHGIRAGTFQLVVDSLVLCAAFFVLPWPNVLLSLVASAVINLNLAINHRPGRYMGMS